MKTSLFVKLWKLVIIFSLVACSTGTDEPAHSQEEMLQDLGITNPSDYSLLSPCQQVDIYSQVGAEFLDIDHATAMVPPWLNEELARQPKGAIADCIARQGDMLLSQLQNAYTTENENKVLKIHALIYIANDLKLINHLEVDNFVLSALCNEELYYRGRIASLYYAAKPNTDLQNFPSPTEIIERFCG